MPLRTGSVITRHSCSLGAVDRQALLHACATSKKDMSDPCCAEMNAQNWEMKTFTGSWRDEQTRDSGQGGKAIDRECGKYPGRNQVDDHGYAQNFEQGRTRVALQAVKTIGVPRDKERKPTEVKLIDVVRYRALAAQGSRVRAKDGVTSRDQPSIVVGRQFHLLARYFTGETHCVHVCETKGMSHAWVFGLTPTSRDVEEHEDQQLAGKGRAPRKDSVEQWSTTRGIIALSSAQAESSAVVKMRSIGYGIKSCTRYFGCNGLGLRWHRA